MDGSSKVIRRHSVWKAAILIDKDENTSVQQAELYGIFPYVWVFTDSQALGLGRR